MRQHLVIAAIACSAGAAHAQEAALKACHDGTLSFPARIAACDAALGVMPANDLAYTKDRAVALLYRADAKSMTGDFDGAIKDADDAYALDRDNRRTSAAQCWARAAANREIEKAKAACDESLAKNPDDPAVLDSAGLVALRQERWLDAARHYTKAYYADTSMTGSLYGVALSAYAQGKTENGDLILARVKQGKPAVIDEFKGYGLTVEGMKAKAPKN